MHGARGKDVLSDHTSFVVVCSVGNYVAYHSVVSSSFDDGCAFFFLSVFCPSRHVVHALLEGHEAAKAAGLSQKNPVEQVWQNIREETCLQFLRSLRGAYLSRRRCLK